MNKYVETERKYQLLLEERDRIMSEIDKLEDDVIKYRFVKVVQACKTFSEEEKGQLCDVIDHCTFIVDGIVSDFRISENDRVEGRINYKKDKKKLEICFWNSVRDGCFVKYYRRKKGN